MVQPDGSRRPLSARAVVQQLESLLQAGVTHLPRRTTPAKADDNNTTSKPPQPESGAAAASTVDRHKADESAQTTGDFAQRPAPAAVAAQSPSITNQPQEAPMMSKSVERSPSDPVALDRPDGESPARGGSAGTAEAPARTTEGAKQQGGGRQKSIFEAASASRPRLTRQQRIEALRVLQEKVAACTRCAELAATRTQTVFGVGNPEPRLCFLGEAPGADEDRQGEPFVGRAGQLLTRIIEACTLRREDVYILNILKCRPPGNRNPLPSEATNCRPFLDEQLEILQPEFICCLGSVAAQNLLATDKSIGKLRGKFYDYHGITVLCTYHPAYLLRNPSAKRLVWEDMQMLMARMGIELKR